jgi:hypothetical protein
MGASLVGKAEHKCTVAGMPRDVSGDGLFDFMMAHAAPMRATRYRHESEKLRQMAELELNEDRRQCFLTLAAQYDQIAGKIAPAVHR